MNDIQTTIEVNGVTKSFRVYSDKSHTLKDRVLSRKRNRYTVHRVLNQVSFNVKAGQALGLIGHNGCGKSTTLKLLNKILYPEYGEIKMHGKISSLIELGAGFHPDMSGRENIYINASIFGLKKKEIDRRLDDIIRFSELEQYIDNPVRTYSSGMYMRLAFAIAINVDADILLVDEILAVGDANFQAKCFDKLSEIKKNGATIVIVSHSMEQIKSICDRVIWLDHGDIRMDGDAQDVCEAYIVTMHDLAEERKRKEKKEQGVDTQEDPNVLYPVKEVTTQSGIYTRRSGTMSARFRLVCLQNGKGENTQQFCYGDQFRVVYIAANDTLKPDKKVNIVFNIFRSDGILTAVFSKEQEQGMFTEAGELGLEIFTIEQLALGQGNYILDAVLTDEHGQAIDCLGHLIEFSVETPKQLGLGIAVMKNTFMPSV